MDEDDLSKQNFPEDSAVKAFDSMSSKVADNRGRGFAGAFVIAPPEGAPIELLLLNSQQSPAVFWSLLKTAAEMALSDIMDKERKSGGYR